MRARNHISVPISLFVVNNFYYNTSPTHHALLLSSSRLSTCNLATGLSTAIGPTNLSAGPIGGMSVERVRHRQLATALAMKDAMVCMVCIDMCSR